MPVYCTEKWMKCADMYTFFWMIREVECNTCLDDLYNLLLGSASLAPRHSPSFSSLAIQGEPGVFPHASMT